MLVQLFKRLGYHGIDDAVEFLMCGVAVLPPLLMLTGFMVAGAMVLFVLIILVAVVGAHAPPPPAADEKLGKPDKNRPR